MARKSKNIEKKAKIKKIYPHEQVRTRIRRTKLYLSKLFEKKAPTEKIDKIIFKLFILEEELSELCKSKN